MNQQEIRMRELEIAVEANQMLLTLESEKAKRASLQIITVGHELGGIEFDAFLNAHRVEDVTPEELAVTIIGIVKANLALLKSIPDAENIVQVNRQLNESKNLLDAQTRRADQAEEEIRVLRKQVAALETAHTDLRRENQRLDATVTASQASAPGADPEQWFGEWQKRKGFSRDNQVLKLIGETGWARVSQILDEGAQRLGVSTKTVQRSVDALYNDGLIERQQGISTGGRPTDIVKLNDKGRWTHVKITGHEPLPSEYDALLKAHKSDRQTALVLKAGDLFTGLGFTVDMHPTEIKIDENRYFKPDFIVAKDGQTYYIEFETGTGNDRASLAHKWENAAIVGGAKICLVTRNSATMNSLCGNIVHWAGDRGRGIHVYATHLEALRTKAPGDSPWVIDKDR